MAENGCPNFWGLFTARVIKSHIKLQLKFDTQKVNWSILRLWHFGRGDYKGPNCGEVLFPNLKAETAPARRPWPGKNRENCAECRNGRARSAISVSRHQRQPDPDRPHACFSGITSKMIVQIPVSFAKIMYDLFTCQICQISKPSLFLTWDAKPAKMSCCPNYLPKLKTENGHVILILNRIAA